MKHSSDAATLRAIITRAALSYGQTAELLHVSQSTVECWLRTNGNPVPMWAVELLEYKTGQRVGAVKPTVYEPLNRRSDWVATSHFNRRQALADELELANYDAGVFTDKPTCDVCGQRFDPIGCHCF